MYLLTDGDVEKKQFFVRKLRRNLQGFWSKLDMIGVTDDLGGLFSKVQKFCGNDIFCVTDSSVPEQDLVKEQTIFVFFPLDTAEKSEQMEKFLNENNFLFLMADDIQFTDRFKINKSYVKGVERSHNNFLNVMLSMSEVSKEIKTHILYLTHLFLMSKVSFNGTHVGGVERPFNLHCGL